MSLSNGLDAANIVNFRHTFGKLYVKQAKNMRIVAFSSTKKRSEHHCWLLFINMPYSVPGQRCGDSYTPIQLVAPRAVRIAVAILAIICTINFTVSFLLITQFFFKFSILQFFNFKIGRGLSPNP